MTERTLVQAAQAGLPDAAGELVERYYSRIFSFVATFRGNDAEDLTQEVFARALVALPRFNGEYQFGAWLMQIARNVCIDEARRQIHRPQPTDPTDLVELEPVATKPDDVWESVSSQIAVTTVHRALAKLPARQRTALVLRELEGMSYADIAVALRISTRAVEVSLARARKRLRVELRQIDMDEEELAACRRAGAMLASGGGVTDEEVSQHVRTCTICQGMARARRPRQAVTAAVGFLALSSGHAAHLVRRQASWAHAVLQSMVNAPAAGVASPMARMAEIGASVAVVAAVSAGSFAGTATQSGWFRPPARPVPLTAPYVPPVLVPAAPAPVAPVAGTGDPSSTRAALPVATQTGGASDPCTAATSAQANQTSAAVASGNVVAELLSPVSALSPLLACNPLLAPVGGLVSGLTASLAPPSTSSTNSSSTSTGNLLQGLLSGAPAPPK